MTLNNKFKQIIDDTIVFVNLKTNDWFIIKSLLINQFPPKDRSNFSRRHYSTKKHTLNSFDKEILTYWKEKTGIDLWVDPKKIHPPKWKRHRSGWGLKKYHAKQRKRKIKMLNKQNRQRGIKPS